jgi:hypothetical protein
MDSKMLILVALGVVLAVSLPVVIFSSPSLIPQEEQQQELDFTVIGENECLRFLEKNVSTCYIPFKTGANEKWQLTIECLEMPSPNAWTDLYLFRGYWDEGTDYKCLSEDLYPIINEIESTDYRFKGNSTFTETFGGSTPQSYTVFFLFPTGGEGTFNIKLNPADQT